MRNCHVFPLNMSYINMRNIAWYWPGIHTNNVDRFMDIPFNLKSSFVKDFNHISENMLNQAKIEISKLINFLHVWSNMASINIVNILSRISFYRNIAINALNYYIKHLSNKHGYWLLIMFQCSQLNHIVTYLALETVLGRMTFLYWVVMTMYTWIIQD